ncbi:tyrosine-type recombinase/integrase [Tenacibaculum maritimum]|uniref:tyrosine-type recombinase/integrase n=2 Tax=Tenacibaculum maritimum TaxID=107401 RepID=UPI003876980C
MMNSSFNEYLIRNGCSKSTIVSYQRTVDKFLHWCSNNNYIIEQMNYNRCMEYFNVLTEKNKRCILTETTVKSYTGAIKSYFNYLVSEDIFEVNPIENYNYSIDKGYEHNVLSKSELELLYDAFPIENIKLPSCKSVAIRNKVITGFIVFQGLDTTILKYLKVEHVNLEKGKLKVPGTKKTEAKTYKLESTQMWTLQQYLLIDREILQKRINDYSEALFPLNSDRFSIITNQVVKVLKTINYRVQDMKQLRASVIANWIQNDDLRTVQRKARHRFISSTEVYLKYKKNDDRDSVDEYQVMK